MYNKLKNKYLVMAVLSAVLFSGVFVPVTGVMAAEDKKPSVLAYLWKTAGDFISFGSGEAESAEDNSENIGFPVAEQKQPKRVIWVTVTAYSSEPAQTDDTPCIPANGYDLCEHYEKYGNANTVAANFLRFDTQVKFPELFGDNGFVVRDRMNARYNGQNRVDIWMPSKQQAVEFGVKRVKMEIY